MHISIKVQGIFRKNTVTLVYLLEIVYENRRKKNELEGLGSYVRIFYAILKTWDFFLKTYKEPIKDFKKGTASFNFCFRQ